MNAYRKQRFCVFWQKVAPGDLSMRTIPSFRWKLADAKVWERGVVPTAEKCPIYDQVEVSGQANLCCVVREAPSYRWMWHILRECYRLNRRCGVEVGLNRFLGASVAVDVKSERLPVDCQSNRTLRTTEYQGWYPPISQCTPCGTGRQSSFISLDI